MTAWGNERKKRNGPQKREIWAHEGERKGTPAGRYCFLRFSRSDSEREKSDWSELIKCQSST